MLHTYKDKPVSAIRLTVSAGWCWKGLLASALLLMATATSHAQSEGSEAPTIRIHGSPSIGNRLMRDLASGFLRNKIGQPDGEGAGFAVSTTPDGDFVLAAKDTSSGKIPIIRIRGNGANQAFDDLSTGDTDIVVAYRPVSDAEHASFKSAASVDLRARSSEYVIGLDGIEIVANKANKLSAISRETLQVIYSKKLNDWGEPGVTKAGLKGPIRAIAPGAGANTAELLRTLVMEGKPPLYQNSLDWGDGVSKLISADPNGIGFVGTRLGGDNRSLDIDECGARYQFDPFVVKTQDHPLAVPLYLYVNSAKPLSARDEFLKFVMSDAGQKIVAQRFVNLDVTFGDDGTTTQRLNTLKQQKPVLAEKHELFGSRIKNAHRLSTTFRFRFDSAALELDSRGERDLEKLVQTVRDADMAEDRVLLFGFADALGPEDYNAKLAARRATSVAKKLRSLGLKIANNDQVFAIGEDAPVGCNALPNGDDDARGRARNRRVEVWVRK